MSYLGYKKMYTIYGTASRPEPVYSEETSGFEEMY